MRQQRIWKGTWKLLTAGLFAVLLLLVSAPAPAGAEGRAMYVTATAYSALDPGNSPYTATGTRDCCSGAKKSTGKQFRARSIDDKDESHYPYQADLEIGGMSCEHCVENVTCALDSVDGTWATVSLAGGRAHVRSKSPIDKNAYRKVVEEAGYRLVAVE